MDWFHFGGSPTHQTVGIDIIKVVQFHDDKIACARSIVTMRRASAVGFAEVVTKSKDHLVAAKSWTSSAKIGRSPPG